MATVSLISAKGWLRRPPRLMVLSQSGAAGARATRPARQSRQPSVSTVGASDLVLAGGRTLISSDMPSRCRRSAERRRRVSGPRRCSSATSSARAREARRSRSAGSALSPQSCHSCSSPLRQRCFRREEGSPPTRPGVRRTSDSRLRPLDELAGEAPRPDAGIADGQKERALGGLVQDLPVVEAEEGMPVPAHLSCI